MLGPHTTWVQTYSPKLLRNRETSCTEAMRDSAERKKRASGQLEPSKGSLRSRYQNRERDSRDLPDTPEILIATHPLCNTESWGRYQTAGWPGLSRFCGLDQDFTTASNTISFLFFFFSPNTISMAKFISISHNWLTHMQQEPSPLIIWRQHVLFSSISLRLSYPTKIMCLLPSRPWSF